MPKIVDHDRRRAELARHVIAVVSRRGLAGATMRSIAREGGFTSGVLSHYFGDKEEMVNFAFGAVAEQIFERVDERLRHASNLRERLEAVLQELLPLGDSMDESVVSVLFWATALHDQALREQFGRKYGQWRDYLRRILTRAIEDGEIAASTDVALLADMLIAITDGLLVSWLLNPERRSGRAKRRQIDRILAVLDL